MAAIVECAPDAIVVTDELGGITGLNRAAEALLALPRDGARGRPFESLLLPPLSRAREEWRALSARPVAALACGNQPVDTHMLRADGSSFPAEVSVAHLSGVGRRSLVCFIHDATDAKRTESRSFLSQWQLRELAGRIGAATEEERTRIARELHDELGQQLMAFGMDVAWLLGRARRNTWGDTEVVDRLLDMASLVDTTAEAVRRLATELRPGVLDNLGLVEAIHWQAREFQRRSGVRVTISRSKLTGNPSRDVATAIFRSFQELLTNVGRHADASTVRVRLQESRLHITLRVSDDGRGIRADALAGLNSFGLVGVRERATLLGGSFAIEGRPGRGTVATVTLPRREGALA